MKRVLIVDDNQLVATMLHEFLTGQGFEIALAHDANDGYAKAVEFHPDLILCDVQLPDVVGFELVRVIKNRHELRHVPIIMITGTAHSTEEKVRGFQLGADDYVLKPFEMSELLERIRAVLRRSNGHEQRPVETPPVPAPQRAPVVGSPVLEKDSAPATLKPVHAAVPSTSPEPRPIAPLELLTRAIFDPLRLPASGYPSAFSRGFLTVAMLLMAAGFLFAEGHTQNPLLVSLAVPLIWGLITSVVVMGCSLLGVTLGWRDGARLVSVAGIPWLLKMCLAVLFSAVTTLSPLHFTAGLALFSADLSSVAARLDLFEIWSMWLLYTMVVRRPACSRGKALVIVGVAWLVPVILTLLMSHLGSR
jgi:CheY-like chemotaxis protein